MRMDNVQIILCCRLVAGFRNLGRKERWFSVRVEAYGRVFKFVGLIRLLEILRVRRVGRWLVVLLVKRVLIRGWLREGWSWLELIVVKLRWVVLRSYLELVC